MLYLIFTITSSNPFILSYDPTSNGFGQAYQVGMAQSMNAFAFYSSTFYMAMRGAGNDVFLKKYHTDLYPDIDTDAPLTKSALTMTAVAPTSYIYQSFSGVLYTVAVDGSIGNGGTPVSSSSLVTVVVSSWSSTDTCYIATASTTKDNTSSEDNTYVDAASYIMWASLFTVAMLTTLNMFLGATSYQSFFSIINEYQIYQTIMLIGVFVPEKVVRFWTSLSFSIFSFSFLVDLGLPNPADWYEGSVGVDQKKSIFKRVGIESGSLFVNQQYLLILTAIFIVFDLILIPFICNYKNRSSKMGRIFNKLHKFFHINVYIRMFIQAFLFVCI